MLFGGAQLLSSHRKRGERLHGEKNNNAKLDLSEASIINNTSFENLISPTHKRTEGRAPLWCSEFTSKAATLQGGFGGNYSCSEHKIWTSVVVPGREPPPIELSPLFESI